MFRKFVLAAAAIAALGTVSLTASTTPAAAWGKGGGFHFHGHHFHGGGLPHLHGLRLLPAQPLGREPVRRSGAPHGQRLLLSRTADAETKSPGLARARPGFLQLRARSTALETFPQDQARSKRSAFITLVHAATKSFTNFSFESAHA